jgi:hypothetical protein
MGREEPGDSLLPITYEWGGALVVLGLKWEWFELFPHQGMNNLRTFVIEKKAQRKRRIFNLKYNIKSYIF